MNVMRLLALGLALTSGLARAEVLYDGASGKTPNQSPFGWLFIAEPLLGTSVTQTATNGVTVLDTTAVTRDKAGYFAFELGTLDRHLGYTVSVTLRLDVETHSSSHRAGFSLIALSSDNLGIELAFWTDLVWVQNRDFTRGEGASYATTSRQVRYELRVSGDQYAVSADGAPLLEGMLRDYSYFGAPYNLTNFLFLGDDTSSAAGRTELAKVEVLRSEPPPPPVLQASGPDPGGTIGLSWPEGFVLERSPSLTAPDWQRQATNSPLTLPAEGPAGFFRLTKP